MKYEVEYEIEEKRVTTGRLVVEATGVDDAIDVAQSALDEYGHDDVEDDERVYSSRVADDFIPQGYEYNVKEAEEFVEKGE